jgi:hypothetical protein
MPTTEGIARLESFDAGDARGLNAQRPRPSASARLHQYLEWSVADRPDDPTRLPDHRTPGPPDIRTMDTRDARTRARGDAAGASEAERER